MIISTIPGGSPFVGDERFTDRSAIGTGFPDHTNASVPNLNDEQPDDWPKYRVMEIELPGISDVGIFMDANGYITGDRANSPRAGMRGSQLQKSPGNQIRRLL